METDLYAIKTKADHITITSSQNLDNHGTQITANVAAIDTKLFNNADDIMAGDLTIYKASTSNSLNVLSDAGNVSRLNVCGNGNVQGTGIVYWGQGSSSYGGWCCYMGDATPDDIGLSAGKFGLQDYITFGAINDGTPKPVFWYPNGGGTIVINSENGLSALEGDIAATNSVGGHTSKNVVISSKLGGLPGYSSSYYPTIRSAYTAIYFAIDGSYVGYIGTNSISDIDFTGSHLSVPKDEDLYTNLQNHIGKVVVSTGDLSTLITDGSNNYVVKTDKDAITIDEAIPIVELCSAYKQKSVFGIISDGKDDEQLGEKHLTRGVMTSVISAPIDDNRIQINSVGEGAIWVNNSRGDFENGDYITTSGVGKGYGTKQDDDIRHNYTIAKITIDCNFGVSSKYECKEITEDGETFLIAFVSCVYCN
jgi:hypothetical protein